MGLVLYNTLAYSYSCRLEYIMPLNLPINQFLLAIIPIFILIYSPHRSTIKQLTITNYIIYTQLHRID